MKRDLVCPLLGMLTSALVLVECAHVGHVDGLAVVLAAVVDGLVWLGVNWVWGNIAAAHADIDRIFTGPQKRADERANDDSVFATAASVRADW